MSSLRPGQWVRITHIPDDVHPWVATIDTGTLIRRKQESDPMTGQPRDSDMWLVQLDLLLQERAIPQADITLLED